MGLKTVILGLGLVVISMGLSGYISRLQAADISPDEVLKSFVVALGQLEGFAYNLRLDLSGNLASPLGGEMHAASVFLTGETLAADVTNPSFFAEGSITTEIDGVPVTLNGSLINSGEYTYFKIEDIQLPLLLPLGSEQLGQWYKIQHAPSSAKGLELGTDANPTFSDADVQAFADNLHEADLVELVEALSDETVGGVRSYHYRVRFKAEALSLLLNRTDQILHKNINHLTLRGLDEYVFDLWISKRDFYPTRISIRGVYQSTDKPIGVGLDLVLSRHNEIEAIRPPSGSASDNYESVLDGFGKL